MKKWHCPFSINHNPYHLVGVIKTTNMNYQEFILRRHLRIYTTYIHRNRKGFRLYKGVEIPEEDFMKATEMPQRPYISQDNPCKKHQYLNVEGCCITNLENLVRCAQ